MVTRNLQPYSYKWSYGAPISRFFSPQLFSGHFCRPHVTLLITCSAPGPTLKKSSWTYFFRLKDRSQHPRGGPGTGLDARHASLYSRRGGANLVRPSRGTGLLLDVTVRYGVWLCLEKKHTHLGLEAYLTHGCLNDLNDLFGKSWCWNNFCLNLSWILGNHPSKLLNVAGLFVVHFGGFLGWSCCRRTWRIIPASI